MFYAVKKPNYGRRKPSYDVYRDNKPFLILAPDARLYFREARAIVNILNRYYEDSDTGTFTTPRRREDDTNNNGPPP